MWNQLLMNDDISMAGRLATIGTLFLFLFLSFPAQAQVLTRDKNPDFRSACEKDPAVQSLQDKVLYGYPEMEPCYEIALIDCELRGSVDPKRKAELEARRAEYLMQASSKRISCSAGSKKDTRLNILISRESEGGSYSDQKRGRQESCITGYLSVNGSVVGYTLELPYRNNQSSISSIPAGQYEAIIKFEGGKGPYTREGFRITLLDVPGRSAIQIHIGNYPTEIEGCILVGTKVHPDTCTLEGSAVAYQSLKKAVYDQAESDANADEKKITVTIQNTGRQE
jgi:hypothetical protein